jgi:hypothetical protein
MQQQAQLKPLRGFDRLAAAGFSEDDIANFRRTFHTQSSENYLDLEPLGEDEDCEFPVTHLNPCHLIIEA